MRPFVLCTLIGGISLPVVFSKLSLRNDEKQTEKEFMHPNVDCDLSPAQLPVTKFSTSNPHPYRRTLIFIRHGQYNVKGRTPDEKTLTSLGWMQAYAAGRRLKRLGIRIDRLIHSDMIRARQSAAALLVGWCGESELFLDTPLLTNLASPTQSYLSGDYSLQKPASLPETAKIPDESLEHSAFLTDPYKPYPGADFVCQESSFLSEGAPLFPPEPPNRSSVSPSTRKLEGARIEQGFRIHVGCRLAPNSATQSSVVPLLTCNPLSTPDPRGADSTETVVFVGHANVFRFWLCRALRLPPEAWLRFHLQHGSISTIDIYCPSGAGQADCTVLAGRIGETGHLPKWMLSR